MNEVRFPGMRRRNLPSIEKGTWKGEIGNSFFELNNNAIIKYRGEILTGETIKKKYEIDGVNYINKEPDFSSLIDTYLGKVYIKEGIPTKRRGNKNSKLGTYDLAECVIAERLGISIEHVRQYMKDKDLCWHECADMHTIIPIPRIINAVFSHTAGIGNALDKATISAILRDKIGEKMIVKSSNIDSVIIDTDQLNCFIKDFSNQFRNLRNQIKNDMCVPNEALGINGSNENNVEINLNNDFTPINFYNKTFYPLQKTQQINERTFLSGEWVTVFDHPFHVENQNVIFNQGSGWPKGPQQTCGSCACGTIMNKTGVCATERDIVAYAWSNGFCSNEGYTKPNDWCQILEGAAGIPAYNATGETLESLASIVEEGRGVIIGVRASLYLPEEYSYIPGQADGHALVLTSIVRNERTKKILEYIVIDSNGTTPNNSVHRVRKNILERAYKKQGMQCVITRDIIW